MLEPLFDSEPSAQFICPSCGVTAFEVVAEPGEEDFYVDDSPAIVMRCLACHTVFRHHLEEVRAAMAGCAD